MKTIEKVCITIWAVNIPLVLIGLLGHLGFGDVRFAWPVMIWAPLSITFCIGVFVTWVWKR